MEAAKRQQEYLRSQLETLHRGGIPEQEALGFEQFEEGVPGCHSTGSLHQTGADPASPLAPEIQAAVLPPRLSAIKLLGYSGTTNPREFFIRYETLMEAAGGGIAGNGTLGCLPKAYFPGLN